MKTTSDYEPLLNAVKNCKSVDDLFNSLNHRNNLAKENKTHIFVWLSSLFFLGISVMFPVLGLLLILVVFAFPTRKYS